MRIFTMDNELNFKDGLEAILEAQTYRQQGWVFAGIFIAAFIIGAFINTFTVLLLLVLVGFTLIAGLDAGIHYGKTVKSDDKLS